MRKPENRKNKIRFLEGIIQGNRSIDELRNKKLKMLLDNTDPKYFCDGVEITKEEFERIVDSIPSGKIKFKVSIQ